MIQFFSKVNGSTFPRPNQERTGIEIIPELKSGQELKLVREPDNKYDHNAIGIWVGNEQLGYVPKETASGLAPEMDNGKEFYCEVSEITGGGDKNYGCNISIYDEEWKEKAITAKTTSDEDNGHNTSFGIDLDNPTDAFNEI